MSALQAVLTDLAAESDELDSVVSRLSPDQWGLVTTPEGWTIAHQIGHLHWTDRQSLLAIHDAGAFNAEIAEFINRADTIVDDEAAAMAELRSGGREGSLVRTAHESDLDGHRSRDGNLGP